MLLLIVSPALVNVQLFPPAVIVTVPVSGSQSIYVVFALSPMRPPCGAFGHAMFARGGVGKFVVPIGKNTSAERLPGLIPSIAIPPPCPVIPVKNTSLGTDNPTSFICVGFGNHCEVAHGISTGGSV